MFSNERDNSPLKFLPVSLHQSEKLSSPGRWSASQAQDGRSAIRRLRCERSKQKSEGRRENRSEPDLDLITLAGEREEEGELRKSQLIQITFSSAACQALSVAPHWPPTSADNGIVIESIQLQFWQASRSLANCRIRMKRASGWAPFTTLELSGRRGPGAKTPTRAQ